MNEFGPLRIQEFQLRTMALAQMQVVSPHQAGMVALQLYDQYLRYGRIRRFWRRLTGKPTRLYTLATAAQASTITGRRDTGVQSVSLNHIRGSEGRSQDFDSRFCPTQEHSRERWLSVATAFLSGAALPPVSLVKLGDSYFVRDGHHRISVARALGYGTIEAQVTVWETAVSLAQPAGDCPAADEWETAVVPAA